MTNCKLLSHNDAEGWKVILGQNPVNQLFWVIICVTKKRMDERIEKHTDSVNALSSAVKGSSPDIIVGVLAIQGAVEEHVLAAKALGAVAKEIRYVEDFDGLHGIILPGGVSSPFIDIFHIALKIITKKTYFRKARPCQSWGRVMAFFRSSRHGYRTVDQWVPWKTFCAKDSVYYIILTCSGCYILNINS